ncbi:MULTISPECIES: CueP family metal-binding protein [unclassified Luteococcus]|uniref:CueP family metal-binding protein n=1 Tax=unclassified Luteococcus TaxID=2639923 RepID=UPI00313ACEC6
MNRRHPLANLLTGGLLAVGLLSVSACSAGQAPQADQPAASAPASASSGDDVLERLGVQGKDAVATIDALDRSQDKRPIEGLKASVKADQLVLSDSTGERSLPLPADEFYLSIAPYLQTTHECFAHSLSGCQGEQVNKKMHVVITDQTGKKLVDEDVTTATNGFVGFWLPRDVKGTVTATMDGKTGSVPFATNSDSPTCLTTLRMA